MRLAWLLLAPIILILPWRLSSLADTNPRIDQAHFSRWVQEVNRAPHWWPEGESLRDALETDRGSTLHQVLRRVYNQPYRLFNLSALATFGTLSLAFGDSFAALVQISVIASVGAAACLVLSVLSLFPMGVGVARATHIRAAIAASAFTFLSYYLHVFSAQGWHNVAIFYVLLHFLAANRLVSALARSEARPSRSVLALFSITFVLSIYSYFMLTWLVGPAFLAQLAVSHRLRTSRAIVAYVGFASAVIAPAALVILLLWQQAVPNIGQAQFTLSGAIERAIDWFARGIAIFSAPGFAAALFGLAWLAAKRIVFPVVFVIQGLILSSISYQFGDVAWPRTFAYAIPFCVIGLSYAAALGLEALRTLASSTSREPRRTMQTLTTAAVLLCCSVSYLVLQVRALESRTVLCHRVPRYCEDYLVGSSIQKLVEAVDAVLPAGASLVASSYPVNDMYWVLSKREDVAFVPPLNQMSRALEQGSLQAYVAQRAERPSGPLYLLLDDSQNPDAVDDATAIFGKEGLGWASDPIRLEKVAAWDTKSVAYNVLSLVRVTGDPLSAAGN